MQALTLLFFFNKQIVFISWLSCLLRNEHLLYECWQTFIRRLLGWAPSTEMCTWICDRFLWVCHWSWIFIISPKSFLEIIVHILGVYWELMFDLGWWGNNFIRCLLFIGGDFTFGILKLYVVFFASIKKRMLLLAKSSTIHAVTGIWIVLIGCSCGTCQ